MEKQKQEFSQFKGQPRLPKFAIPNRYDLKLKPDLTSCKFTGAVDISIDVVSVTKFLVLNASELSVCPGSVNFTSNNKVLEAFDVEMCEKDEIMVLEFEENLPLGVGVLSMDFEGTLNDKMKGFYRSTYEHNGEKKNMAVTQFEPADARRCFPCWDEPACKATFKITLEVPAELIALSNMPVIEEKINGNLKTVYYQESPIMSTYLQTCAICLASMKPRHGHAIFTAECSHTFHFHCITSNIKHGKQSCPVCRVNWKEIPFQSPDTNKSQGQVRINNVSWPQIKVEFVKFFPLNVNVRSDFLLINSRTL